MFKVTSLGSDPELVLLKDNTKKPTTAIGLKSCLGTVRLYADNALAEFNHDPFHPTEFNLGIKETLAFVDKLLSTFKGGCHYKIGQCEGVYTDKQLDFPLATEVGCEPFSSAYALTKDFTPQPYTDNSRFAGGHIHIGYDKSTLPPHLLIQLLDKELLSLDPNHNKTKRSSFYGAKGSFRHKPYGVEYRSISNWWLSNPSLVVDVLKDIENFINKKYYGA